MELNKIANLSQALKRENHKGKILMPKTTITSLFLDTEFTSLNLQAQLISIALVSAQGSSFYGEFTDYSKELITPWVKEKVLGKLCLTGKNQPKLKGKRWRIKGDTQAIKTALLQFINQFDKVVIWADHVAYDWVFFCELFGGALALPENIQIHPLDLPTALSINGINPDINRAKFVGKKAIKSFPKHAKQRHNALYDAYLLRASVQKLLQ